MNRKPVQDVSWGNLRCFVFLLCEAGLIVGLLLIAESLGL